MIAFDMKCEHGHVFEAWFRNSETYEAQKAQAQIQCPTCGTYKVEKAMMAPNLAVKGARSTHMKEAHLPAESHEAVNGLMGEALERLRQHVEKNCDYVGKGFAEEVRAIHYGEKTARGIYGETTPEERKELQDEGIDVISLPMQVKADTKTN